MKEDAVKRWKDVNLFQIDRERVGGLKEQTATDADWMAVFVTSRPRQFEVVENDCSGRDGLGLPCARFDLEYHCDQRDGSRVPLFTVSNDPTPCQITGRLKHDISSRLIVTDAPVAVHSRTVSRTKQGSLAATYLCLADKESLFDVDAIVVIGISADRKHRVSLGRGSGPLD